jgi:two-component system, response regulator / RNA-binding antiterminator
MRVLIIDPDGARARLVVEGLAADARDVRHLPSFADVEAELAGYAPDAVVVACERLDAGALERLREIGRSHPRPVVVFVDRSAPAQAEAALEAGVAAYVVDGLSPGRVGPVLEVALSRFAMTQRLRDELEKARTDLAARKIIDRAKGLLMKERGLDEDAAYSALRKLAMDTGRSLAAVAADLLVMAGVLKGGPTSS